MMSLQKELLFKIIRRKISACSRYFEDDIPRDRSKFLSGKVNKMVPVVRIGWRQRPEDRGWHLPLVFTADKVEERVKKSNSKSITYLLFNESFNSTCLVSCHVSSHMMNPYTFSDLVNYLRLVVEAGNILILRVFIILFQTRDSLHRVPDLFSLSSAGGHVKIVKRCLLWPARQPCRLCNDLQSQGFHQGPDGVREEVVVS